jgi:GT2 family glycosyltransferase
MDSAMSRENQPQQTSVLVVIVNYRTPDLVLKCLQTLNEERHSCPALKVSVLDNDSGDGSFPQLCQAVRDAKWEGWITIVANASNVGFGAGNNVLLRTDLAATNPADMYLLLNPDTEVQPGMVSTMLDFFDTHPSASILGPSTESAPGALESSAFRFPSLFGDFCSGFRLGVLNRLFSKWVVAPAPQSVPHQSDWVSGGCMLVRREVFEAIGLFDETFFLYYEEIDLCHRARQKGFLTWYVPSAKLTHWAGASTGITSDGGPRHRMPGWWFASRRHYMSKFHNKIYVLGCDLMFVLGRSVWQLRIWVTKSESKDPCHFLWDFFRYNLLGQRWDQK